MNTIKKLLICLAISCTVISNASASVVLTTFGTSSSPTFAIDGSTSFSSASQSASSVNIIGSDFGSSLVGTFSTVDITGNSSSLTLFGSTTSAPSSGFSVTLFDTNGKTALYDGGSWTALTGGTSTLAFTSAEAGFNYTSVYGLSLGTQGTTGSINATLTGLSAGVVPEPTRLLMAFVGLGAIAFRRRR